MLSVTDYHRSHLSHEAAPHTSQQGRSQYTSKQCGRGCGGEIPCALLLGCRLVQPPWGTVWRFRKRLDTDLPYDPRSHFREFIQKTPNTNWKAHAPLRALQCCPQQPRCGSAQCPRGREMKKPVLRAWSPSAAGRGTADHVRQHGGAWRALHSVRSVSQMKEVP